MTSLPARFPRASLLQHAAFLESRLQRLLDETHDLIEQCEDSGDHLRTRKLAQRFNALDEARKLANDCRMALWELP